jgi:hypothetical protein
MMVAKLGIGLAQAPHCRGYVSQKPRGFGCRQRMVGDLEIGLCVAAVPNKGYENLHSYIGWNNMLRYRRTEKDGLDVRVFDCERFRMLRECGIVEAATSCARAYSQHGDRTCFRIFSAIWSCCSIND